MSIIEEFGALVSDFTEKANDFIAKAKQADNPQEKPPVTGRPFMKGVNEPEIGQMIWYKDYASNQLIGTNYHPWDVNMLKAGLLYPTEQDCIEGKKRREVRARYEAMGRNFIRGGTNWFALTLDGIVSLFDTKVSCYGIPYFDTRKSCQAAIAAIDAEYGEGAFAKYVLGVNENG